MMRAVLIVLCTSACSSAAITQTLADAAPPDAFVADDASDGGGALAFLTDKPALEDGGAVIVDDVTYLSGSLVIHGLVCRPAGGGVHPLVMLNHGGFYGIDPTTRDQCVAFAQAGIVAGVSSYRGEDGSQGSVEVCLGEVDDVLAMKTVLSAQPYVDAARVATVGFSHGACIATMLALRDNTLRAAVDFFGPSDIGTEYDFWQTELAGGEPFCTSIGASTSTCSSFHNLLVSTCNSAIHGTPAEKPLEYAKRSPATTLSTLSVPIMFFQGTYDYAIDLAQACQKRAILSPRTWYLDASLKVQNPSNACGGAFETGPLPTSFPDKSYLFIYEAQGHGFTGPANDSADALAFTFLVGHL